MKTQVINPNTRLKAIIATVPLLLAIPFVAMQFTNEVDWKLFDFIIAGTLLLSTGLGIELAIRKVKSTQWRVGICLAILLLLFLVWAELAVGLFGTPLAGS